MPEEKIVTFVPENNQGVIHENLDSADQFVADVPVEVYTQIVDQKDLEENGFNTYREG